MSCQDDRNEEQYIRAYPSHTAQTCSICLFVWDKMRPSSRLNVVLGLWSCLSVLTDAQGQPDSRGKTPYDYIDPLIGTINGGEEIDTLGTKQCY